MAKHLRPLLVATLLTIALLEAALSLLDPLGLRYVYQVGLLDTHTTGSPYRFMAGHYTLGEWAFTIADDGTRATIPGDGCRVVFLGDSVTFGWGVDDTQTFAALLADTWGVQTSNAGMPGYNSAQVLARSQQLDYDAGVYLIFDNDTEQAHDHGGLVQYTGFNVLGQSALAFYVRYLTPGTVTTGDHDPDRFWRDLEQLSNDPRLTWVAFDRPFGQAIAQRYPVVLIPAYTETVSIADRHPNAAGHAQIAAAMQDLMPC